MARRSVTRQAAIDGWPGERGERVRPGSDPQRIPAENLPTAARLFIRQQVCERCGPPGQRPAIELADRRPQRSDEVNVQLSIPIDGYNPITPIWAGPGCHRIGQFIGFIPNPEKIQIAAIDSRYAIAAVLTRLYLVAGGEPAGTIRGAASQQINSDTAQR